VLAARGDHRRHGGRGDLGSNYRTNEYGRFRTNPERL
jgi:hypothetical protein